MNKIFFLVAFGLCAIFTSSCGSKPIMRGCEKIAPDLNLYRNCEEVK